MRVVLDANVLVSGLLSPKGPPGQILDAWLAGFFTLVISPQLLQELERVFEYPRIREHLSVEIQSNLVNLLVSNTERIEGNLSISVLTHDPSDNMYLACAVEGNVDYLVTGNLKHFEETLNKYTNLKIVAPRAFLEIIIEAWNLPL